jgi:hypothetical protein
MKRKVIEKIDNLHIPTNCVAVGNEAYCIDLSKPNQISDKYTLSYLGYDLWYPTNVVADDNKYVINNCILTSNCNKNNLQPGCIAKCFSNVNNNIISENYVWNGSEFNQNNLINKE